MIWIVIIHWNVLFTFWYMHTHTHIHTVWQKKITICLRGTNFIPTRSKKEHHIGNFSGISIKYLSTDYFRTHESWKSCLIPYPSHQILILEPGKDSIRRKRKCSRLNVYVPELHVEILNPWVIGIGRWLGHKSRSPWMGLVPL